MIKLFLQYVSGVMVAFMLGACIWAVCFGPAFFLDTVIMNVPTAFYLIIFLALPLGCPMGAYFVDKLIYKSATYYAWRIVAGFLMSIFGIVLVWRILPFFGIIMHDWIPLIHGVYYGDYLLPFIAAFFSLIGYKGVGLFVPLKGNNQIRIDEKTEELSNGNWRVFVVKKLPIIILLIVSLLIFLIIVCRSSTYRM